MSGNELALARFRIDADLNNLGMEWCDMVTIERVHGTTGRIPKGMLPMQHEHIGVLPDSRRLWPHLREDRKATATAAASTLLFT